MSKGTNMRRHTPLFSIMKVLITLAWYIQLILFIIVIIGISGGTFFQSDRIYRWPITFSETSYNNLTSTDKNNSVVEVAVTKGDLLFKGLNGFENVAITYIGVTLVFGTSLLITFQLKKIFANLAKNSAFIQENRKRIRLIGLILLVSALAKFIFGLFYSRYLNTHFQWNEKVSFMQSLDVYSIFMALLVICLGEIVRDGTALQEENNLTI